VDWRGGGGGADLSGVVGPSWGVSGPSRGVFRPFSGVAYRLEQVLMGSQIHGMSWHLFVISIFSPTAVKGVPGVTLGFLRLPPIDNAVKGPLGPWWPLGAIWEGIDRTMGLR